MRGDVTPVIILTAFDQVSARIEGPNAGADDYMVKPFDLSEVSARIGSVARRYTGNPNPIVSHGPLEIDFAARSIHRDGRTVALTAREPLAHRDRVARDIQINLGLPLLIVIPLALLAILLVVRADSVINVI